MKAAKKILTLALALCVAMTMECGVFATNAAYAAEEAESKAEPIIEGAEYDKGTVIVTFKEGTTDKKINKIADANDAEAESIEKTEDNKVVLMDLDKGVSVEEGIEEFAEESKVVSVQPNYIYKNVEAASESESADADEGTSEEPSESKASEEISEIGGDHGKHIPVRTRITGIFRGDV